MNSTKPAPFVHGSAARIGVLVTNLGTPAAPTTRAVRRYLAEFLSDPRVVELPRWFWIPLLHAVVLRVRPRRSAHAYAQVWGPEGSPLLAISRRQAQALQQRLDADYGGRVRVALGMRYGQPSLESALEELRSAGVQRVLLLPLYPQYSAATTASTFDEVARVFTGWRWIPDVRFVSCYHDHPSYVAALRASVEAHWARTGRGRTLVFSFHGIPERYFLAGDPYHCQCQKTARLVAEALGLAPEQWRIAYQSRLGPQGWLQPYTEVLLTELARSGTQGVDLICPGFAADCLETLEEIAIRARETFIEAGGREFTYVPALNEDPAHIDLLYDLVVRNTSGWPEAAPEFDLEASGRQLEASRRRALAMGAQA